MKPLYWLYFNGYPMSTIEDFRQNGEEWVKLHGPKFLKQAEENKKKLINDINSLAQDNAMLLQTIVTTEQLPKWERWLGLTDITKYVIYSRGPVKNRNHASSPPRLYFTLFDIPKGGIHATGV